MSGMQRIEGVISWDETFMSIAAVTRMRSKDPKTQVGACIVSVDNRILTVGYNGTPVGFEDNLFPWGNDSEDILETKYPYVIHAERNAILNFRGLLSEFTNATLYTTHSPCNECAKEIVQVGIKKVVYLKEYVASNGLSSATGRMFAAADVTMVALNGDLVAVRDNLLLD